VGCGQFLNQEPRIKRQDFFCKELEVVFARYGLRVTRLRLASIFILIGIWCLVLVIGCCQLLATGF
jgi:hypothetical protein